MYVTGCERSAREERIAEYRQPGREEDLGRVAAWRKSASFRERRRSPRYDATRGKIPPPPAHTCTYGEKKTTGDEEEAAATERGRGQKLLPVYYVTSDAPLLILLFPFLRRSLAKGKKR